MEDLSKSSHHVIKRSRYVSNAGDAGRLLIDVALLMGRQYIQRATTNNIISHKYSSTNNYQQNSRNTTWWMTLYSNWVPIYVWTVVLLAISFRRWYVLHGISILVIDKIVQVGIKWILYTLDDDELYAAYKFIFGWMSLILKEGEKILTSQATWSYVMAFSAIKAAPTQLSFARYVCRYKMKFLRKEFVDELGSQRYNTVKHQLQKVSSIMSHHHTAEGGHA